MTEELGQERKMLQDIKCNQHWPTPLRGQTTNHPEKEKIREQSYQRRIDGKDRKNSHGEANAPRYQIQSTLAKATRMTRWECGRPSR